MDQKRPVKARPLTASLKNSPPDMRRIVRNRAECLICGEEIESKHVNDYVTCLCGNLSVDGGLDCLWRAVRNPTTVRDLSLFWDDLEDIAADLEEEGQEEDQ